MIDKLDVQLPTSTPFTPAFEELYRIVGQRTMRRTDKHLQIGSFEQFGHDVTLSRTIRRSDRWIVSIIAVGTKTGAWMREEIERVFQTSVMGLRIVRADLAADLPLTIDWLRKNTTVQFKRQTQQYVESDGVVQTLYFGKSPNQIVMYDKRAERIDHLARHARQSRGSGAVKRMYSEIYQRSIAQPWSRVERRYGSTAIPHDMRTLADLYRNATTANPFDVVRTNAIAEVEPECTDCSPREHYLVHGVWRDIREFGLHKTRRRLDAMSNRNGARLMKKVASRFPQVATVAVPDLNTLYRQSVTAQLSA